MVTIIRGLPGSGKTTFARKLNPGALLIEGDQFYTDKRGKYNFCPTKGNSSEYVCQMLDAALDLGLDAVMITCTSPDLRTHKILCDIARKHKHTVDKYWVDYNNGDTSQNLHEVPEAAIEHMKEKWTRCVGEKIIERKDAIAGKHEYGYTYEMVSKLPAWFVLKQKGKNTCGARTGRLGRNVKLNARSSRN